MSIFIFELVLELPDSHLIHAYNDKLYESTPSATSPTTTTATASVDSN